MRHDRSAAGCWFGRSGFYAWISWVFRGGRRPICGLIPCPEAAGTSKQSRGRFLMPLRGGAGFSGAARKHKKTKGLGGALRVGIAAFTCPTHGPIPPPTHRRPLPGPLWVGWPLQGPWVTPRAPQRPQRGDGRPSPQQQYPAQTTAGRPPERTMDTPNANQAPQGAGTSPRII